MKNTPTRKPSQAIDHLAAIAPQFQHSNFEAWSNAVRAQMLAALEKRNR